MKKKITNTALVIVSIFVALVLGESLLVLKNRDMKNYDIEMWRYAKTLKCLSTNPVLGHEHIPNKQSVLQGVSIRTNNLGLRGADVDINAPKKRRILFLGSSATLGWGVLEEDTLTHILDVNMGPNTEVLNAGIGNYNAVRYVELFMTKLYVLNPTDIVIHFFQNDAEVLQTSSGNWFLRNSQFAVTLWRIYQRLASDESENSLVDYYHTLYQPDATGFQEMEKAFDRLEEYTRGNGINVYFVIMPDFHNITNYQFDFVNDIMKVEAQNRGFNYIDLLPAFKDIEQSQTLWAMPSDPHPNALAHKIMADYLVDLLRPPAITSTTH